MKQWVLRQAQGATLMDKLLEGRGIRTSEERERFLNPSLTRDGHDPFLMKDMERAVVRIAGAVEKREPIVIFGDYDADGIPGAALLYEFFKKIGYQNIKVYIPDRYNEKYGLSEVSIRKFAEEGTKVLISVDCGITDVYEAELAQSLGIDMIITDHHLPHSQLPPAYAVINNKRPDDTYPFKYLCGAGTAFKLVQALGRSGRFAGVGEIEREVLDLAAVATICDMVPVVGENRAIVREGLGQIAQARRPGLAAIFRQARLNQAQANEDDIGFLIGPRINISSRMSHGVDAFHLLTTTDHLLAKTLAEGLEARNTERRATVQVIMDMVEREYGGAPIPEVIAHGHESWRVGVLGLTANRLVEKYERPVCLWTRHAGGIIKGSVRTDGSVTVMDWFEAAGGAEFFADYGGHAFSGGFSLLPERESELRERLFDAHKRLEKNESEQEKLYIDAHLALAEVNWQTWAEIEPLAPFGEGNAKPLFLFRSLELRTCLPMGKDANHMRLSLRQNARERECQTEVFGFFLTPRDFPLLSFSPGERLDLLANLEKTHYRGRPELRLRLVDIRPMSHI